MENVIEIQEMLLFCYAFRNPNPYVKYHFRQEGNGKAELRFIINEETEIKLLAVVDKTGSLRKIDQELHAYRAFKHQLRQQADDDDRRVVFCDRLLQNILF